MALNLGARRWIGAEPEQEPVSAGRPNEPAAPARNDQDEERELEIIRRIRQKIAERTPEGASREEQEQLARDIAWKETAELPKARREAIVREILQSVGGGLGPLQPFVDDPTVTEIMVNAPDQVYIERAGEMVLTNVRFRSDEDVQGLVERIVGEIGRRFDLSNPMVDARLRDGSRVNAIRPPLALKGTAVTIRKFPRAFTFDDLVRSGSIPQDGDFDVAAALRWAVPNRLNIVVSGGTGSGKCLRGDVPVLLADGRLLPIREIVENSTVGPWLLEPDGWMWRPARGINVLAWDQETGQLSARPVAAVWRGPAPKELLRVVTASGREVVVTKEHPLPVLDGDMVRWRAASKLAPGDRVAVPRRLPVEGVAGRSLWPYLARRVFDVYVVADPSLVRKWPKAARWWRKSGVLPWRAFVEMVGDLGLKPSEWPHLVVKGKTSPTPVRWPLRVSPDLAAWCAMVAADGHIDKASVRFHKSDEELLRRFGDLTQRLFGVPTTVRKYGDRCPFALVSSRPVAEFAKFALGVDAGPKAAAISVPEWLSGASNEELAAWVSALLSCDGSVLAAKGGVEITTASRDVGFFLVYALARLGVHARRYNKVVPNYPDRVYHRVTITGAEEISRLDKRLEWFSGEKQARLRQVLSKVGMAICAADVVPLYGDVIRQRRTVLGMTQTELAAALGVSRRAVGFYESGLRGMSQRVARRAVSVLSFPHIVASPDVFWDSVRRVERVPCGDQFVYDLSVGDTEDGGNFVAGWGPMVVHNTTLLNALTGLIPHHERLVIIEDAAELQPQQPHIVRLETRPPTVEGKGEVRIRHLLVNALRMRPDRIIVGEVRSDEVIDMLQAMNTGHPGSMTTVHANSTRDCLTRLETMVLMGSSGDMPLRAVRQQIASAVHLVVQIARTRLPDGTVRRWVTELAAMRGLDPATGDYRIETLYRRELPKEVEADIPDWARRWFAGGAAL